MSKSKSTFPNDLYSRRQLAAWLGVSIETIKRRERAGVLRAIRLNSRLIRYRREDVERMIEQAS